MALIEEEPRSVPCAAHHALSRAASGKSVVVFVTMVFPSAVPAVVMPSALVAVLAFIAISVAIVNSVTGSNGSAAFEGRLRCTQAIARDVGASTNPGEAAGRMVCLRRCPPRACLTVLLDNSHHVGSFSLRHASSRCRRPLMHADE